MEKIDINNWPRKKHYDWFKTFSNPTYSMNVRLNVTNLIEFSKERNESFFIAMLFAVTKGCNMVDSMRLRIINDEVYQFSNINPSYTIMLNDGTYENTRNENSNDYKTFYDITHKAIEETKKQDKLNQKDYNPKNIWNEYYITCIPWCDFTSMTHPIPDDLQSLSVPRICWSKFVENEHNQYELTLNITVNHMLVDGYELSQVFNNIQNILNEPKKYC